MNKLEESFKELDKEHDKIQKAFGNILLCFAGLIGLVIIGIVYLIVK